MNVDSIQIKIESVSQLDHEEFVWANLSIVAHDADTGAFPKVQVSVPLSRSFDWTLFQLESMALQATRKVIEGILLHTSEQGD